MLSYHRGLLFVFMYTLLITEFANAVPKASWKFNQTSLTVKGLSPQRPKFLKSPRLSYRISGHVSSSESRPSDHDVCLICQDKWIFVSPSRYLELVLKKTLEKRFLYEKYDRGLKDLGIALVAASETLVLSLSSLCALQHELFLIYTLQPNTLKELLMAAHNLSLFMMLGLHLKGASVIGETAIHSEYRYAGRNKKKSLTDGWNQRIGEFSLVVIPVSLLLSDRLSTFCARGAGVFLGISLGEFIFSSLKGFVEKSVKAKVGKLHPKIASVIAYEMESIVLAKNQVFYRLMIKESLENPTSFKAKDYDSARALTDALDDMARAIWNRRSKEITDSVSP